MVICLLVIDFPELGTEHGCALGFFFRLDKDIYMMENNCRQRTSYGCVIRQRKPMVSVTNPGVIKCCGYNGLASAVLGGCIASDWEARHRVRPVLMNTYVDGHSKVKAGV